MITKKGNILIVVLLLIVALVITVFGGYMCLKAMVPSPLDPPMIPSEISNQIANWKTYSSKNGLFTISYPSSWSINDTGGYNFIFNHQIQFDIVIHSRGDTEYVDNLWKSTLCGGISENTDGCRLIHNKEVYKFSQGKDTVFVKVDGNNQIHAYIPNERKDTTAEIYTLALNDKNLFDQILSTFKFL